MSKKIIRLRDADLAAYGVKQPVSLPSMPA